MPISNIRILQHQYINKHTLLMVVIFMCTGYQAKAQDSTRTIAPDTTLIIEENSPGLDTIKIKSYAKRFNPQKALLYAAILPGSGQVYNKKYWKLPLVYGGFAFLGNGINFYNTNYRKYKIELFDVLNQQNANAVSASKLNENQLRNIVDKYRRERDFFIVLTGLWYILQIVDAHVDAHLKEFDLNPNLRVKVEPTIKQDMLLGRQSGFSISIRF